MRRLSPGELQLLRLLLSGVESPVRVGTLESIEVEPMEDGGMGSFYFPIPNTPRAHGRFGKCVAEAEFTDADGVVVSAALNVDRDGKTLRTRYLEA